MSEKENRRPRLIGSEEVSIDEKGRVLLSKKKRDRLGENFAIVLSPLGCLIVYPEVRFDEIYDQIAPGQGFDPAQEALSRMFLGEADDERPGGVERRGRDAVGRPAAAVAGQSVDAVRPAVGEFNR